MKLTKIIPARRHTITANWCRKDYIEMSPRYRNTRNRINDGRDKIDRMCLCFWCKHRFEDGEMMSLVAFNGKVGNRVLCSKCATELEASKDEIKSAAVADAVKKSSAAIFQPGKEKS